MFRDTSGIFWHDHSFTSFHFFPASKQVKLFPRLKSSRGNPRNQSRPIRFYQNSDVMVTSKKEAASLSEVYQNCRPLLDDIILLRREEFRDK